jgi:hypothetical protein
MNTINISNMNAINIANMNAINNCLRYFSFFLALWYLSILFKYII